jgi:hypothetical protein
MKFVELEKIDIDNRDFNYTNDGLFLLFKNYIEYKEVIYDEEGIEITMFQRMSVVCSAIGYLTDEKLLNHTIDYLKIFDLIDGVKEDFENELMSSYSGNDLTTIKAIYYSLSSLYKLNIKSLKFPNSENSILLQIKIKDRIIEHNLQEALKSIHEKNVFYFENQISTLSINKQKEAIDIWIRGASKVAYSKKTKMFKKDIKYLQGITNHLIEPQQQISISKREDVKVIALLHYYNSSFITRDNGQSIAKEYGYIAKNSGEGLYQDFIFFADKANRLASGESRVKCENKIKYFKRVIELLTEAEAREKAETELNLLKIKLDTFF